MKGYRCFLICLIFSSFFFYKCSQAAGVNVCGSEKLTCDNSECILRDDWCNEKIDCVDGSDEQYCERKRWFSSVPDNHCNDKHFVCEDGMCIPAVARCDGFSDCFDSTDEDNCATSTTATSSISHVEIEQDNGTDSMENTDGYERPIASSSIFTEISTSTTTRSTSTATMRTTLPPRIHTPSVPTPTSFYDRRNKEEWINLNLQSPYYHGRNDQQHVNGHQIRNGQINRQTRNDQYYGRHWDNQHNVQNQYFRPSYLRPQGSNQDTAPDQLLPANEEIFHPSVYRSRTSTLAPVTPPPRARHDLTGTEYDSSRTSRDSYLQPQHPVYIQPRLVLHPPDHTRHLFTHRKTSLLTLSPFYFARNYTEDNAYRFEENVRRSKQWLVSRRDGSFTWGDDTPRAVVSLSLITNSFKSDVVDNDLMRKGLQTHLGLKLLRNRTDPMPVTRLAMYINALLATCQNPRDFLGIDLVADLYKRRYQLSRSESTVSPMVYLSLCLSDNFISWQDIDDLERLLSTPHDDEEAKDRCILAITALACILQRRENFNQEAQSKLYQIYDNLNQALHRLLYQWRNQRGFGSIYSTAIAAQALMSLNSTSDTWDPMPTLDYLAEHQLPDGSFGDVLATYEILPALSGRSLLHLRNTKCDQTVAANRTLTPRDILNLTGPRKNIFYSVAVGYPQRISFSMQLNVPVNTNLFDIMRIAEDFDSRFSFRYKIAHHGAINVYAIGGLPNDPERKMYWNLYLLDPGREVDLSRRHTGDIQGIIPPDGQEFLFWYLQTD